MKRTLTDLVVVAERLRVGHFLGGHGEPGERERQPEARARGPAEGRAASHIIQAYRVELQLRAP